MIRIGALALLLLSCGGPAVSPAQSASTPTAAASGPAAPNLAPDVLLPLLHTPEVQRELGLADAARLSSLETMLRQIDGPWWRARILPTDKQRAVTAEQERQAREWLTKSLAPDRARRLAEIEYRAQGARMLLRPDVAERLKLTAKQQRDLTEAAQATDAAAQQLQAAVVSGKPTAERTPLQAAFDEAKQREQELPKRTLSAEQQRAVVALLGQPFETSGLQRVYPLAPELEPSAHWLNSQPLTLAGLRGKVVVLHFYAFQCINCRRNLPHYNNWADEFRGKDVVVLGIQTPETAAERRPDAIAQAAKDEGLQYPVLLDLESKNWTAWSNTMWPTVYVIDKRGYIRLWWQGELNWQGATGDATVRDTVLKLLEE